MHKNSVNFCRRCLYSTSHPLGLTLDEEGVCSGCRIHEEKDQLDWSARWERLKCIVKPYKIKKSNNYDCIVPVSGGQDSYYIVHLVKNKLGLNPLLVTYNKYFNTSLGIQNISNLRIKFNCDILYQNVNPISVKKITRTTLRQFGSIYWPIIAGQTVFPVQTSVRLKIPLIIWGAHQGLEQVGMFSHEHEIEMTRRYRKEHDLMGYEADDLLSLFDSLKDEDIWQYRYPSDSDLKKYDVRGIYLGNYVRWDPKEQHEEMISKFGYFTGKFGRTFDKYDHPDCYNYMEIHDLIKLYKHGYSKVTDHATREIRHGRITREQGLQLVKQMERIEVSNIKKFTEWLGVNEHAFHFILNQHKNKNFWTQKNFNDWHFHGLSDLQNINNNSVIDHKKIKFIDKESNYNESSEYITIGKGY